MGCLSLWWGMGRMLGLRIGESALPVGLSHAGTMTARLDASGSIFRFTCVGEQMRLQGEGIEKDKIREGQGSQRLFTCHGGDYQCTVPTYCQTCSLLH